MSDNTSQLKELRTMVQTALATREGFPSREDIREMVHALRATPLYQGVTEEEGEALADELVHIHAVTMLSEVTLYERDFEPWLDHVRGDLDFFYWERYRKYMAGLGLGRQVLGTMDQTTDRILGLLENPERQGKWDRRGIVVGQVQSGKTANYIGLACKAADAGYKVIIIIAGIHNNLRNQTQRRVDEGLIGFDSSKLTKGEEATVGVGRYDPSRRPNAFTNSMRDFNQATATSVGVPLENLKEPAIFVIKKNYRTLHSLIEWTKLHNAQRGRTSVGSPMLLIDDEADHASINVAPDHDVSRINGQIRQLLNLFDRSCYVGYTATPFANIFIDPDTDHEMFEQDLFPRDFIVGLDPPSNYIGPDQVFGSESDTFEPDTSVRFIDDNGDLLPLSHKITHIVEDLPESLLEAIRTFILARTIRHHRGQRTEHHSMLVNVSRFTNVQTLISVLISEKIEEIRRHVRVNGAKEGTAALRDPEIGALHQVFLREYGDISDVEWSDLQPLLLDSVGSVQVIEVNSRASQPLSYAENREHGLNVIAVGGYSLSRGLTLEGLTVSYFLRNSMMYDTLMQMGRWFGYRPGYEDLFRVWMPEEVAGWYAHITNSIAELREDLRRMSVLNATPRDFGLRVRSHPDTLLVTALNKMGTGKSYTVSVGLANSLIETVFLRRDQGSIRTNLKAVASLVENIRKIGRSIEQTSDSDGPSYGPLVRDVPADLIIDFVAGFVNEPTSTPTDPKLVGPYLQNHRNGFLATWDVLFASRARPAPGELTDSRLGFEIHCQRRTAGPQSNADTLWVTSRQRVASRGVEMVGLTPDEIEEAKRYHRKDREIPRDVPDGQVNFPDRAFRRFRSKPLLIVHLLAIANKSPQKGEEKEDLSAATPVVAWSMSFPPTPSGEEEGNVEYMVNTTYLREATWLRDRYESEGEYEEDAAGDNDN